jgi:hypothetical protein
LAGVTANADDMLYWDTGTSSVPADLDLGSKQKQELTFDGMITAGYLSLQDIN